MDLSNTFIPPSYPLSIPTHPTYPNPLHQLLPPLTFTRTPIGTPHRSPTHPIAPYPVAPYPIAPYPIAPYPVAPYPVAPYPVAPYPNPLGDQESSDGPPAAEPEDCRHVVHRQVGRPASIRARTAAEGGAGRLRMRRHGSRQGRVAICRGAHRNLRVPAQRRRRARTAL